MAQAALQDGVGTVVEGGERRHVAAPPDPDAVGGPELRGQVLRVLLSCRGVVPRQRVIF